MASVSEQFLLATDRLYDECSRGVDELSRIVVSVSSNHAPATRTYLLPIVYAYWERFFRGVFAEYVRAVSSARVSLNDIDDALARSWLKRSFGDALETGSAQSITDLMGKKPLSESQAMLASLARAFSSPVEFGDPATWIRTYSNVGYDTLEDNCKTLGLEVLSIKRALEQGSGLHLFPQLKALVDSRNDIAHGSTFQPIDSATWNEKVKFCSSLMNAVQMELYARLQTLESRLPGGGGSL